MSGTGGGGKEPAKIKGPKSAYFMFQDVYRPQVIAAEPELAKKTAEVSKRVGEGWKALSEEEKAAYGAAASQAKKDFIATHGALPRVNRKPKAGKGAAAPAPAPPGGKKVKKEPGPKNAYQFFLAMNRALIVRRNPSATVPEIAKLVGQAWKDLEDKSVYDELAKKEKEAFSAAAAAKAAAPAAPPPAAAAAEAAAKATAEAEEEEEEEGEEGEGEGEQANEDA